MILQRLKDLVLSSLSNIKTTIGGLAAIAAAFLPKHGPLIAAIALGLTAIFATQDSKIKPS